MTEASERLLYEHVGETALCYVLAVEAESLRLRFEDRTKNRLSQNRETVLEQLVALDEQIGGWQQGRSTAGEWATRLANRPDDSKQTSSGNMLRILAGGTLVALPSSISRIDEILLRIAQESYPGLLVKESDDPFDRRFGLPASIFRHPLNETFQELAMADRDFKCLFTKESEGSGWGGSTLRSTGQGGGHQLWTFAETIVKSGWTLAQLDALQPTPEAFLRGVRQSIRTIRLAIRGTETTVPARVGLAGILLPEDVNEIDFGWAKVRRSDERDERFTKETTLEGQLTSTNQAGETVVMNYSGDLVVELEVPYVVALKDLDMGKGWPDELKVSFQAVEHAIENLRLGLILAFPDQRSMLHTSWQVMIDPFSQHQGAGWSDLKRAVGLAPVRLLVEQVDVWKEWSGSVAEHRTPSIGVAVRRMLAAVAERRTPEDVLVDAVIVWENLFGARTETTLRVTSSLAWLLGTSAADRKQRQKVYKKIYSLRSDVVHGAATVNQSKLQAGATDAVNISISALRTVFSERPSLLAIQSSEDRSLEILHAGDRADT